MTKTTAPPPLAQLLARARTLTSTAATGELTLPQAAVLTGLDTPTLRDMAVRGELLTERTHPEPVLATEGVLAWMDDRRLPVTALDALAYALDDGDRLNRRAHTRDESAHRSTVTGTVWQVEGSPHLAGPHTTALKAWNRGEGTAAVNLLAGERAPLGIRRRVDVSRELDQRTLWAIDPPLGHYQRFLLHALRVRGEAGYPVHVVDTARHPALVRRGPLPTMTVYPHRAVYVARAAPDGEGASAADGAVRVADPDLATALSDLLDHLAAQREPISAFARPHR